MDREDLIECVKRNLDAVGSIEDVVISCFEDLWIANKYSEDEIYCLQEDKIWEDLSNYDLKIILDYLEEELQDNFEMMYPNGYDEDAEDF